MSYEEYLKSNKWKTKRKEKAEEQNYICQKCNKKIMCNYHIHHKTYKRLGNERLSDLQFLCEECHNKLHRDRQLKKNKESGKRSFNKYFNCPYCLELFYVKKFINSGNTRCPKCNHYINRMYVINSNI